MVMSNLNDIIACTLGINLNDNYEGTLDRINFDSSDDIELEDLFRDFN